MNHIAPDPNRPSQSKIQLCINVKTKTNWMSGRETLVVTNCSPPGITLDMVYKGSKGDTPFHLSPNGEWNKKFWDGATAIKRARNGLLVTAVSLNGSQVFAHQVEDQIQVTENFGWGALADHCVSNNPEAVEIFLALGAA